METVSLATMSLWMKARYLLVGIRGKRTWHSQWTTESSYLKQVNETIMIVNSNTTTWLDKYNVKKSLLNMITMSQVERKQMTNSHVESVNVCKKTSSNSFMSCQNISYESIALHFVNNMHEHIAEPSSGSSRLINLKTNKLHHLTNAEGNPALV